MIFFSKIDNNTVKTQILYFAPRGEGGGVLEVYMTGVGVGEVEVEDYFD